VLLQEPVPPLLASALKVYKGLRVHQLTVEFLDIKSKRHSKNCNRSSKQPTPLSVDPTEVSYRSIRCIRRVSILLSYPCNTHKLTCHKPSSPNKMCQKHHLSFWTPTNIPDPSLEDLAKRNQLTETSNPFADIARITYYECRAQNPNNPKYSRTPLCPSASSQPSLRTGPIRPFCAGDDRCAVRVANFARAFEAAAQALVDARRGVPRTYPAHEVWELWKRAEGALVEWRTVWEAHSRCPARRCGDEVVCRLVSLGVMDRPVELWPDRRLGENPFLVVLR
jgi:hypothetical protein